jgi:acetyl-CoA carboxylase beta subunit
MEPLLRIVKINSPDDLPTEEGHYWTYQGDIHCLTSEPYNKEANDHWLANVEWYLAPQEQEDKRLIYHLNCEKCGDLFWSNEAFPKSQYCYKCEQEQQEKKTSWRDFTMTDKVDEPPKEVKSALDILKNELSPAVYGGLIHTFDIDRIRKAMEAYHAQFQTEQRHTTCDSCAMLVDNLCQLDVSVCPDCFEHSMWTAKTEQRQMTDEEIEEWSKQFEGRYSIEMIFTLQEGAKAMRDGLIKTKQ